VTPLRVRLYHQTGYGAIRKWGFTAGWQL